NRDSLWAALRVLYDGAMTLVRVGSKTIVGTADDAAELDLAGARIILRAAKGAGVRALLAYSEAEGLIADDGEWGSSTDEEVGDPAFHVEDVTRGPAYPVTSWASLTNYDLGSDAGNPTKVTPGDNGFTPETVANPRHVNFVFNGLFARLQSIDDEIQDI